MKYNHTFCEYEYYIWINGCGLIYNEICPLKYGVDEAKVCYFHPYSAIYTPCTINHNTEIQGIPKVLFSQKSNFPRIPWIPRNHTLQMSNLCSSHVIHPQPSQAEAQHSTLDTAQRGFDYSKPCPRSIALSLYSKYMRWAELEALETKQVCLRGSPRVDVSSVEGVEELTQVEFQDIWRRRKNTP